MFDHMSDLVLHGDERTANADGKGRVPSLNAFQVHFRTIGIADGITHDIGRQMKPSEDFYGPGDQARNLLFASHIGPYKIGLPSSRAKLFGERFSAIRSEEHTSELQSLMRISYAVFCLKKKKK